MGKTIRILALDLATKTGWAHSLGPSGVQDFSPRRGDSPGMRWLNFRGWLNRVLDDAPADVIAYEQAHHRGGAATHVAHALISTVEAIAAERNIEVTNRHTSTIKKHAISTGGRGKVEMLEAARAKWGERTIQDDNEADALWLLDLVTNELT
jgi:hypothetical protein